MARKYTGYTGVKQQSSQTEAPGQWISPTECVRESYSLSYPPLPIQRYVPAGAVCFAVTSGVVDTQRAENDMLLCDGSAVSRSTYPDLFAAIGTTYGAGDGSTTFNVPNLYDKFIYLRGETASGVTPVTGSGYIRENHNHTFTTTRYESNSGIDPLPAQASWKGNGFGPQTNSSNDGGINAEVRKREMVPLLSVSNTTAVGLGTVHPFLLPNYDGSYVPEGYLVCSGQAISRSDNQALFSVLGTRYGAGDTLTTFNVPDLRGIFVSSSRQPASVTQPSGVLPGGNFLPDEFLQHSHRYQYEPQKQFSTNNQPQPSLPFGLGGSTVPASSQSVGNANESRVDNISVVWFLSA